MQGKRHDRVVEMRLCSFSGKVGDYKVPFKSTRKCRSTLQGHDLSGKERFRPETRHMIMLEVQKQCFVGFKGERFRFYLSDEGYRNAKRSEQEGEIKIKSHAAVVAGKLYPDRKPKQQER